MKTLNVKVKTRYEDMIPIHQHVWSDEDPRIEYYVGNLWDCPEDACIHRDLVSAYEWLEAVQLGMTLAREGYDELNIEDIEWEYDD